MTRALLFGAVGLLAAASLARAECDDLQELSLPLSGDTTLELSSASVDCPYLANSVLKEFVIDGGTLTRTGPSTTNFFNLKFTVMDGAGLIFDFDRTEFGPNYGYEQEDDHTSYMVHVLSGEIAGTGTGNLRSFFANEAGGDRVQSGASGRQTHLQFMSNVVFNECDSNVFRDNYGSLRFYDDVTFTDNSYIAIYNVGGTVRIDGDAVFAKNGRGFDGHSGGAFANTRVGTAIFHGLAAFSNNWCDDSGGGVFNGADSKITFYKQATFYDNRCGEGDGGAVDNYGGDIRFRGAVAVSGNQAGDNGGGISTGNGGMTTFYGRTTIQSNKSYDTGGAMSLYKGGESGDNVVTFKKPDKVRISDNESEIGCNNIYVEETSELVGYDTTSDICDQA